MNSSRRYSDPLMDYAYMRSFELYRQQQQTQQQQQPGQVNYFEQMISFRKELIRQRNEFIEKALREYVPAWFLFSYAGLSLALGITLIVLETIGLTTKTYTHFAYTGFWVGAFFVIDGLITFLLIAKKSYNTYILLFLFNSFAMSIGITGFVMSISSVALKKNTWLTFLIMSLEFVGFVISLVFIIAIQCLIRRGRSINV